jgi:hypothetical protein
MIKTLVVLIVLAGLIWFNWDKLPQPVQNILSDAKTVSGEVYENGKDMPDPVKRYVDTNITPKAKKIKDIILE